MQSQPQPFAPAPQTSQQPLQNVASPFEVQQPAPAQPLDARGMRSFGGAATSLSGTAPQRPGPLEPLQMGGMARNNSAGAVRAPGSPKRVLNRPSAAALPATSYPAPSHTAVDVPPSPPAPPAPTAPQPTTADSYKDAVHYAQPMLNPKSGQAVEAHVFTQFTTGLLGAPVATEARAAANAASTQPGEQDGLALRPKPMINAQSLNKMEQRLARAVQVRTGKLTEFLEAPWTAGATPAGGMTTTGCMPRMCCWYVQHVVEQIICWRVCLLIARFT